jgi:hypothetical protein
MAHFAELDQNNIVLRVIVVHNNDCLDADGNESEMVGAGFCAKLFGGNWKQTSYNGSIRKNYAGIGYIYRPDIDAFVAPQPYPSWSLDSDPHPTDGKMYSWDEATQLWVLIF